MNTTCTQGIDLFFIMGTDYCAQGSEIWCTIIKGKLSLKVVRDSSVGLAISYGLDSLGNEPRWGRDFRHSYKSVLVSTQPPTQRYWVSFSGMKGARRGVDHPSPSIEDKERVQLYFKPPPPSLWAFLSCSMVKFIFKY